MKQRSRKFWNVDRDKEARREDWECVGRGCAFGNGLQPLQICPSRSQRGWERGLDELWEELGSVPGSVCCSLALAGFHEDEEPWEHPQATLCPEFQGRALGIFVTSMGGVTELLLSH